MPPLRRLRPVGALFGVTLAACSTNVTFDHPDATLAWPAHRPTLAMPDGGTIWVTSSLADELAQIDRTAGTVLGSYRIGIDPIAINGPTGLALDPRTGTLFVSLTFPEPVPPPGPHAGGFVAPDATHVHGAGEPGFVVALDPHDLSERGRAQVDVNPTELQRSLDGTQLFVSHFDLGRAFTAIEADAGIDAQRAAVWVLDVTTLGRVASATVCVAPRGMAQAADDPTSLYVACYGEDAIAQVHLGTTLGVQLFPIHAPTTTFPNTPDGPMQLVARTVEPTLIVMDINGSTLRLFDRRTNTFDPTRIVRLPAVPVGLVESPDGSAVFVITQIPDGVTRVRTSDWQVDASVRWGASDCALPGRIALGPDGRYYALCQPYRAPGVLVTFDPSTLAITAHIGPLGEQPESMVFSP